MLNNRQEVIDAFQTGIFLYIDGFQIKEESEEEWEEKKMTLKNLSNVENESKSINRDLFKDYFNFLVPSALVKELFKIKDKKKNNDLTNTI